LFRPLPVTNPKEIVHLHSAFPSGGVSHPQYDDLRADADSFGGIAAFERAWDLRMRIGDESVVVGGLAISDNYFEVLGVAAQIGRMASREEGESGPAIVLSDRIWKSH